MRFIGRTNHLGIEILWAIWMVCFQRTARGHRYILVNTESKSEQQQTQYLVLQMPPLSSPLPLAIAAPPPTTLAASSSLSVHPPPTETEQWLAESMIVIPNYLGMRLPPLFSCFSTSSTCWPRIEDVSDANTKEDDFDKIDSNHNDSPFHMSPPPFLQLLVIYFMLFVLCIFVFSKGYVSATFVLFISISYFSFVFAFSYFYSVYLISLFLLNSFSCTGGCEPHFQTSSFTYFFNWFIMLGHGNNTLVVLARLINFFGEALVLFVPLYISFYHCSYIVSMICKHWGQCISLCAWS